MNFENQINVALGKIVLAESPVVLVAAGIGSCILLCIHHRESRTAGAAHIMLPYRNNRALDTKKPAKFADIAVGRIIKMFKKRGLKQDSLKAKIVGGAQLFHFSQVPNIGKKNIHVVRKALRELHIPVTGTDVGGNQGRSMWFFAGTGKIIVRTKFDNIIEI